MVTFDDKSHYNAVYLRYIQYSSFYFFIRRLVVKSGFHLFQLQEWLDVHADVVLDIYWDVRVLLNQHCWQEQWISSKKLETKVVSCLTYDANTYMQVHAKPCPTQVNVRYNLSVTGRNFGFMPKFTKHNIMVMVNRIVDIEANVKLLTVRHHQQITQGFSCSSVENIQSTIEITDEKK